MSSTYCAYSWQVDSAWASGDHNKARLLSARAKKINIAGIVFSVVATVCIVLVIVIVNVA